MDKLSKTMILEDILNKQKKGKVIKSILDNIVLLSSLKGFKVNKKVKLFTYFQHFTFNIGIGSSHLMLNLVIRKNDTECKVDNLELRLTGNNVDFVDNFKSKSIKTLMNNQHFFSYDEKGIVEILKKVNDVVIKH